MTGKDFSLIYYINFGVPSISASQDMMRFYAKCGAKNLQLDLPSREPDPALENDFIMGRMRRALELCGDMRQYLDAIAQVKREFPDLSIEMTVYEDAVADAGTPAFIRFCAQAGVTRVSWLSRREHPDAALLQSLRDTGIQILHPILYHLPQDKIDDAVARREPVVLMLEGGRGEPARPGCERLDGALRFLREQGVREPICVTMGIRSPARVVEVKRQGANGAYVGSRLIKAWDDPPELERLIRAFERARLR